MWIKGLGGMSFGAFVEDGDQRLLVFDGASATFRTALTETGAAFRPYGPADVALGRVLIGGLAAGPEGARVGSELYELRGDGTLRLFADVVPGPDSSFVDLAETFEIGEADTYIVHSRVFGGTEVQVIESDGRVQPLADFFPTIDSFTEIRLAPPYRGDVAFLGEVDGLGHVPFVLDLDRGVYRGLPFLDEEVGGIDFQNLFSSGDTLFAKVSTSRYGRELWVLGEDDLWSLVVDHSPSFASGSPTYEFSWNGQDYFTAVDDARGRELYRYLPDRGLALVRDADPGRGSGAYFSTEFAYDGVLYVRLNGTEGLFRLTENGTRLARVEEFAPGTGGDLPSYVVDLERGEVSRLGAGETIYLRSETGLTPLDLPPGTVGHVGLHRGALYVETTLAGEQAFTLHVLSESGRWLPVYRSTDTHYDERFVHGVLAEDVPAPDVYLGDDSAELVVARPAGAVVHAAGGADRLEGSNVADILLAGAGDDTVLGEGGSDSINGGAGSDLLRGGRGEDTIVAVGSDRVMADAGNDVLRLIGSERFGDDLVAFNASGGGQIGTGLRLGLEGKIRLEAVSEGGRGADLLLLGDEAEALFLHDAFSAFHDSLRLSADASGRASAARLSGIETIRAGGGDDVIDLTSPDYGLAGLALTVNGGAGDDVIWGSEADERLLGGAGDDTLFGGAGADVVSGGAGADTFEFTVTSRATRLTDFDPGEGDAIRLYETEGVRFDVGSLSLTGAGLSIRGRGAEGAFRLEIGLEDAAALTLSQLAAAVEFV